MLPDLSYLPDRFQFRRPVRDSRDGIGLRLRIGFADQMFRSRSHDAVIRVRDEAGKAIETYEQPSEFKDW